MPDRLLPSLRRPEACLSHLVCAVIPMAPCPACTRGSLEPVWPRLRALPKGLQAINAAIPVACLERFN